MKNTINTKWIENITFSSQLGDHEVITDASAIHGGDNSAPSPKPLMVVALAGCTGIDVISTLKKMRIEVEDFNMEIESELTDETPAVYIGMHINYQFTGKDLDPKKLQRAVELSQDKYCGVSAMYKKIMDITWEISIIDGDVE